MCGDAVCISKAPSMEHTKRAKRTRRADIYIDRYFLASGHIYLQNAMSVCGAVSVYASVHLRMQNHNVSYYIFVFSPWSLRVVSIVCVWASIFWRTIWPVIAPASTLDVDSSLFSPLRWPKNQFDCGGGGGLGIAMVDRELCGLERGHQGSPLGNRLLDSISDIKGFQTRGHSHHHAAWPNRISYEIIFEWIYTQLFSIDSPRFETEIPYYYSLHTIASLFREIVMIFSIPPSTDERPKKYENLYIYIEIIFTTRSARTKVGSNAKWFFGVLYSFDMWNHELRCSLQKQFGIIHMFFGGMCVCIFYSGWMFCLVRVIESRVMYAWRKAIF